MKKTLGIIIFILISGFIFSLENASEKASLRYAQIANSFLLDNNFSEALKNADYGLNYNSELSDLYYIKAKALTGLNYEKYKVLENVQTAYDLNNYREINPALVKTFYASLLCDTMRPEQAIELLEKKPVVFTSETEYIKALSLYRLGKKQEARRVIDSARKVFTDNPIFPELFFTWDNPAFTDKKLAAIFINNIDSYAKKNPRILFLASRFVNDKDNKFLFRYNETTPKDLDFIAECLSKKIIFTETQAFELIKEITAKTFSLKHILDFKTLFIELSEEYKNYIDNYNGLILQDYFFDGIDDTLIYVTNGKTTKIETYNFQDDKISELIQFSENNISSISFLKINLGFVYSEYPVVSGMSFSTGENINTVPYEVSAKLVTLKKDFSFNYINKYDVPTVDEKLLQQFNFNKYLSSVSSFYTLTPDGIKIVFHLLEGKIINADYYKDDKKISYTAFENGIPVFRKTDKDLDGIFETTEIFGNDVSKAKLCQTDSERLLLEKSLYGTLKLDEAIYLSKVNADLNNDFINDYAEIFDDEDFLIKEWDSDFDGMFDTEYKRSKKDFSKEFIVYTQPVSNKKIQTELYNGIPVKIDDSISVKNVTKGESKFFYWIGIKIVTEAETKIIQVLNKETTCFIDFDNKKIKGTRIGSFYFGEVIDEN